MSLENDLFKNKYLKYKKKYIDLKKSGGGLLGGKCKVKQCTCVKLKYIKNRNGTNTEFCECGHMKGQHAFI